MEKQFYEEVEESAPPYEESDVTLKPAENAALRSPSSLSAQERAARIRQQRVKLLVDGHVEPLLENALVHGHGQTIIVVPSGTITTTSILTTTSLVHRPKSANTNIVQLQGPNSTAAFWTQPKVVEDLEKVIRSNISGMPSKLKSAESLPPRPTNSSSLVTAQKSWMKRTFGIPGPEHDPTGSTGEWRLGWRSEDEKLGPGLAQGECAISVRSKDIAFRIETELGLLATTTVKCIEIELESGG